jgi:hypothetical protein
MATAARRQQRGSWEVGRSSLWHSGLVPDLVKFVEPPSRPCGRAIGYAATGSPHRTSCPGQAVGRVKKHPAMKTVEMQADPSAALEI